MINFPLYTENTAQDTGKVTFSRPFVYLINFDLRSFSLSCFSLVCSVRVIGESDIMQEFLSESDEVCVSFIVLILTLLDVDVAIYV